MYHNQLAPMLCKLFNYIFDNNIYPEICRKGIIVPVPKNGNLNDVNNYRGIILTSIFSKICSMLIDTRLRKWANDNNVLHDNQLGFVKGKNTVDCIFVLISIIDKIVKHEKRKLYCSFVDLEQFDMFYNDNRLTVVPKFTYLGVTLSSNGLFYQALKALANQSLKSLFALNSIFDTVAL